MKKNDISDQTILFSMEGMDKYRVVRETNALL